VTSNLGFTLSNLWFFMCGRGNHERTIAQLKSGLAFHTIPTMAYAANSAWQQFVALAHNLITNFQIATGAFRRKPSRKRTVLHVLQSIQTLRFILLNRAAVLVRPQGGPRLRLMNNAETRRIYQRITAALAHAA
jgi:Transposase DDE domain group 1